MFPRKVTADAIRNLTDPSERAMVAVRLADWATGQWPTFDRVRWYIACDVTRAWARGWEQP